MAGGGNYIPIQAGEAYNLTLELHDGEDSIPKRVFVDLRLPNQQNLEATFELPTVVTVYFKKMRGLSRVMELKKSSPIFAS